MLSVITDFIAEGRLTVFFGSFSTFVTGEDMERLWRHFGLEWKMGDYVRTNVYLNEYVFLNTFSDRD